MQEAFGTATPMYVPNPPPVKEILENLADGIFTMNSAENKELKQQRIQFYHHVDKRTPD